MNPNMINPSYINNSTKKYELEGGAYHPNYYNVNNNLNDKKDSIPNVLNKGFSSHYFSTPELLK